MRLSLYNNDVLAGTTSNCQRQAWLVGERSRLSLYLAPLRRYFKFLSNSSTNVRIASTANVAPAVDKTVVVLPCNRHPALVLLS